jgi:hypothetical protein
MKRAGVRVMNSVAIVTRARSEIDEATVLRLARSNGG